MININNAVQFQHLIWDRVMKHANIVVDATCGNAVSYTHLNRYLEGEELDDFQ